MANVGRIFSHRGARIAAGVLFALTLAALVSAPIAWAAEPTSPGFLDTIANVIGGIFMYAASGIGALISNFIEVIVAVIQYNNFSTSPVVGAGWAIIRDTVNMFYVVILIAIAFGTIIGAERFKWRQDVPKLLQWAIIINFSKTLCGLMIDASQVVTLTFANAIKDIAGGNFVSFLGLNSILSLSTQTPDLMSGNPGGYQSFDYMVGGIMAFVMMLIVLVVLAALLAILAFRIVMLWILITVSPLTWFVHSQNVVKSGAYEEWWGNFKCYLVVGPVLVFFLWLALAVAGAGNIAAVEGFSVSDTNNGGLINEIFDMPRLTSFILGLALIMAGFQQAASMCKSAQGMGSLSVGGILKKAQGFTTSIARKPGDLALGGAKAVGQRIPLAGSRGLLVNRAQVARGLQTATRQVPGWAGGSRLTAALGGVAEGAEKEQKEYKEGQAKLASAAGAAFVNDDQKKAFMAQAAGNLDKLGGTVRAAPNKDAVLANLKKAVEDKDYRKKLGPDFDKLMTAYGKDVEDKFGADDKFKGAFKDFKKGRADLFVPKSKDGKTDWKATLKDMDAIKGFDFDSVKSMPKEEKENLATYLKEFKNTDSYDAAQNAVSAYQLLEQKKLAKGVSTDIFAEKPVQDTLLADVDADYSAQSGTFSSPAMSRRITDAVSADPGKYVTDITSRIQATGGKDVELGRATMAGLLGGGGGKGGDKTGGLLNQVTKNTPNAAGARTALVGAAQILHSMPPTKDNEKKLKGLAAQWQNAGLGDLTAEANIMPIPDIEMASQLGRTKKAYRDDQPEMKRLVELSDTEFENELQTIDNDLMAETRRAAAATSDAEKTRSAAELANLKTRKAEMAKAQTARYAQMDQTTFTNEVDGVETDLADETKKMNEATDDQTRNLAQEQKAVLEERKSVLNRVRGIRERAEKVAALPQEEGKKKKGNA